jgi:nicotinamide mononucleotide (NMN) deamidase PncC
VCPLTRLLHLEPVQFSLLAIDFSLLGRKPPLNVSVLLLARLHLVTDQRAAEKTDRGTNAGAGAGIAGGAADNCAKTGSANGSVYCALLARRQRFRATEETTRQNNRRNNVDHFHRRFPGDIICTRDSIA